MENKINIAELLKDCPKGMELDCTMFDNATLDCIDYNSCYPIRIRMREGAEVYLTQYGQWNHYDYAKCVIFPKGKTTWEGFVPPCKFKDGDIIYIKSVSNTEMGAIYKKENAELIYDYCSISFTTKSFYNYDNNVLISKNNIDISRLATEEEKQKLFNAIKANGYKWNAETKTLEKLIEPIFKVGNKIKSKISQCEYTVLDIRENVYILHYAPDKFYNYHLPFCDEYKYDLIPNKFDINTLKPFESRVLMRESNNDCWRPAIYGYRNSINKRFYAIAGGAYPQCIPYDVNKELLGTTEDCDEYYKVW